MLEIQPRIVDRCAYRVGEAEITPAAPHLFALLLALTLDAPGIWTRRGLQELLFGDVAERDASHRLRQLLYKLRSAGVSLAETTDGLIRIVNPVADPLGPLDESPGAPDDGAAGVVLPQYAPRLPAPFLDWLERRRDALQRASFARRIAALRAARERQDWRAAADLADLLQRQERLTEELAEAGAEAHAMLGERDAAVAVIDHFVHESETPLTMYPQLRRLRTRILGTPLRHREGTLRGRQECLAFLAEQWRLATGGTGGRACAIFGPAGMGKSRVGETFAASARLAGAEVLVYRCDGQHRQFPLALFSQVIRDLRSRRGSLGADPALRAALDTVAPESAEPRPVAGDFEGRRDELRRAIVDLLEAVSAERSVLLVVDDAHLLDDASRAVIRSIAESPNAAAVLVVLGCRPRPDDHTLVSSARRFATYALPPLDAADSRALLLEVAAPQALSAAQLDWAVGHAGGNAFYLHALARHPCADVSLPVHVRSLAQTGYLALSPDARTVLDVALLLDTLATPARVARASALPDRELMASLRELEDADLLMLEGGLLVGPHAIVREALMELSPVAARGIMHRRIGAMLAEECEDPKRARIVAWAAVSSWLAAEEVESAVELALKVARDADHVGEPEVGALLLNGLPRKALPNAIRRIVLDQIVRLAQSGQCYSALVAAVKERTALARASNEGVDIITLNVLRTLTVDLYNSANQSATDTLRGIIHNPDISTALRVDAVCRLLACADMHIDRSLAEEALANLQIPELHGMAHDPRYMRAELVYHTVFGEVPRALELIGILNSVYPVASSDEEAVKSRSYIAFANIRLGLFSDALQVALADMEHARARHHWGANEIATTMAAEAALHVGDFGLANDLMHAYERQRRSRRASRSKRMPSWYGPALMLAMHAEDFRRAERIVSALLSSDGVFKTPRLRAVALSHAVRLNQIKNPSHREETVPSALSQVFAHSRSLGAQDSTAEALWHNAIRKGDPDKASILLGDYLRVRREIGAPETNFRLSTAADPKWQAYHSEQVK